MMKSDKAVCTNDAIEDLGRAMTYEAIFSSLIENKVLAMKRECEERQRAKRQKRKSFGRILFSRKFFGSGNTGGKKSATLAVTELENGEKPEAIDNNATSQLVDCHVRDEIKPRFSNRRQDYEATCNEIEQAGQMVAIPTRKIKNSKTSQKTIVRQGEDSVASTLYNDSLSLSEKNGASSLGGGVQNLVVEVLTHHHDDRFSYDDDGQSIPLPVTEEVNIGRTFDVISLGSPTDEHNTSAMADDSLTSIRDSIDSLSFPSSRYTVSVSGFKSGTACPEITVNPSYLESASLIFDKSRSKRLRILEAKSISAQCSPILPRHLQPTTTLKLPVVTSSHTQTQDRGTFRQGETFKYHSQQVAFSNVLENVGRHKEDASILISRQNTSEDSANVTLSTLLNEGEDPFTIGRDLAKKSKSTSLLLVSDRKSQNSLNKHSLSSRLDSKTRSSVKQLVAARRESYITYTTTTSNNFPVITTTAASPAASINGAMVVTPTANGEAGGVYNGGNGSGSSVYATPTDEFVPAPSAIVPSAALPSETAKLHRMTSTSTGSSVAPTGCCATKSRDKEKRFKPSWPSGQSGSDDEYRKRKRKYKRHHRCSDPVLVYPSPSGLQHCILSMPPNQPIQFHYNEDFVYDMTMQADSDKNDDLEEIVPNSRTRKHRHHKHKKRHRHKKPKILVHDLDTQMVKVIDPDDLPQRARWTIIATACLLLLMCLMLVGITLRMAPIIDDMGKFCFTCQK